MQRNFERHYPSLDIQLLGINEIGHESGNASICNGRDLPWLQDVDADGNSVSDVWYDSWKITYRDVVVVDQQNEKVTIYNVTTHNLADPGNYATLEQIFIDAAAVTPPKTAWQHEIEPLDVDGNKQVTPLDALLCINQLGAYGPTAELPESGPGPRDAFIDPNGDGLITPLDPLAVINHLRQFSSVDEAPLSSGATGGEDPATDHGLVGDMGSLRTSARSVGFESAASSSEVAAVDTVFAEAAALVSARQADLTPGGPLLTTRTMADNQARADRLELASIPVIELEAIRQFRSSL
jgi:hypothetical protein